MPSDATHPTSAQSILKPEYIVYTMYAIGRDGLVHRRKAVIFSPLTSALTETKCKNDLLSREKTTTPYTNISWSPEGKGLTSWIFFVMFIMILLLYHLVSWGRCGA